ncbi:permease [Naumannella halotolerans]|uniref:permease n=1 Tax=Naumannella halotolerans TaxID=993414 RepID=UPI001061E501|nr:permease [Naumannella halotolerans]
MRTWVETLQFFGLLLLELVALFTVITFAVVLIDRRIGAETLKRWLSGNRITAPLKGVAVGIITPFCSCSTVPMLMGMLRAGAPFTAAAAFLISSPLIDPVILAMLAVMISWQFMLAYTVVITISSIAIALVWDRLGLANQVRKVIVTGGAVDAGPWRGLASEAKPAIVETLRTLKKLSIPLAIGVAVGAVIHGAVPSSVLAGLGNAAWAIPVAALIAIPLYIRGTAAIPIGLSLVGAGVGIGPIFAMIISGTGASLPEATMLSGIFKPRLLAAFLFSIFAIAVAGGFILPIFT